MFFYNFFNILILFLKKKCHMLYLWYDVWHCSLT